MAENAAAPVARIEALKTLIRLMSAYSAYKQEEEGVRRLLDRHSLGFRTPEEAVGILAEKLLCQYAAAEQARAKVKEIYAKFMGLLPSALGEGGAFERDGVIYISRGGEVINTLTGNSIDHNTFGYMLMEHRVPLEELLEKM